jgi:hypothetical protein
VPKNEFVKVHLELSLAYTVVRANEPLLKVADSPIGKWDGGPSTFSQLWAERLDASDMFKAGLNQPCEAFETVRMDGGTGCKVTSKYRDYRAGLKVGNHVHAGSTGGSSTLLHSHQNERRSSILELPAPSQPGLLAADPRLVNLYLTAQGFPNCVHHCATEFVKHHPRSLVTRKTELMLQEQSGNATLVRGH